jgi:8-oxo-dGTP pyrophosphatase MutT (NUDIX family)
MKDLIRSRLAELEPRKLLDGFTREAAVLIPIFELQNEYHFLLTRRTDEVETHKGQISFPGGMREDNEELFETAFRETYEEVGIEESQIESLGRFHDYISITGFRVTPFAGFIQGPFTTRPHAREVAEVIYVPVRIFQDPSLVRVKKSPWITREVNVYYYTFGAHQIWGLTARIIKDFLEFLKI